MYPIKIENWGKLSSLLDYLISLKNNNNNNSLEMNLKIEEINSVPSVQVNKKIRIAILYSNPIDVEHYYNVDLIIDLATIIGSFFLCNKRTIVEDHKGQFNSPFILRTGKLVEN